MAERDAGVLVDPHTVGVRSAMAQAGRHAPSDQRELFAGFTARGVEKPVMPHIDFFCLRTTRLRSELLLRCEIRFGCIC